MGAEAIRQQRRRVGDFSAKHSHILRPPLASVKQSPLAITRMGTAMKAQPQEARGRGMGPVCVLTIRRVPAHGVQVEVAVMEEELVLGALAFP